MANKLHNIIVWENSAFRVGQKKSEETSYKFYIEVRYLQSSTTKIELNFYWNITGTYWGITKYLNIAKWNLESV